MANPAGSSAVTRLVQGRSEARPLSQKDQAPHPSKVRQAVSRAPKIRCHEQTYAQHAFSEETEKAYAIPCKSWSCPACARTRRQLVVFMVGRGIERRFEEGQRVRFLTLTEDPKKPFGSVADLQRSFARFRVAAKRHGWIRSYVSVTELTENGRPHIHVLATGSYMPRETRKVRKNGKEVIELGLRDVAERAGFGRVVDVREIDQEATRGPTAPAYVAKELSGYVSKGAGWAKARRRRPVNFSRDWYPGGQEQARKDMLAEHLEDSDEERDDGPFWHVFGHPAETLVITGRDENGQVVRVRDVATEAGAEPEQRPSGRDSESERAARVSAGRQEPQSPQLRPLPQKPPDEIELVAKSEDENRKQTADLADAFSIRRRAGPQKKAA